MGYQEENAKTIDRWIKEEDWEWGRPVSHETYLDACNGKWDIKLTPARFVPHAWFGDLKEKKVLGLASGGGQQMPVFAALGAVCTVLDYSDAQLEGDRLVADREGYHIEIVKADMTKPLPFRDGQFDMIVNPVSLCYIEEIRPLFKECYRILGKGGVFIAGFDSGMNFIFDDEETHVRNTLPFNPLKNPEQMKEMQDCDGGVEFSHTVEEEVNGQLEAGFTLTALLEDTNGTGLLAEHNIPSFILTRAVK